MPAIREDYLLILTAIGPVYIKDRPYLRDHRLRWIDIRSGPTRNCPQLSKKAEIEDGGIRDDLVVRAAYPQHGWFMADCSEIGLVQILRRERVVRSLRSR